MRRLRSERIGKRCWFELTRFHEIAFRLFLNIVPVIRQDVGCLLKNGSLIILREATVSVIVTPPNKLQ